MFKKKTVIVVACHQGPTFIIAYCQVTTNLVDQKWGLSKQTFVNPGFL